ncbi:glycine/betaine ABC transporter permease [Salinisphaera orenii YIM 95161]|uniref:Glycine/betaine ABC transporter permease n=1 Tax=Salinisphaera orenii YIM 95161 TaxID=1051139 RepID=A0A423PV50_9GAMM|nr:BCCT family transporter [Salinisphaera halophila]ROO29431.1 glycine/betaine ABC transporter permease [Salinisphaera halophila YIM 95161]
MSITPSRSQRVYIGSALIVLLLVIVGASMPDAFGKAADTALTTASHYFGWLYLISVFGFVVFLIGLAFSRYGKIRLGAPYSEPEYTFFSWVSMLLAAGFGVGLVFYGLAEPVLHYLKPPYDDMPGPTPESARYAIQYSFFHWGISQWAGFSIVGLIIAYFQFRKRRSGLVSTVMEPVTDKLPAPARQPTSDALNIFAVVATVMGVATSLGLGVLQINGGLNQVFGIPDTTLWKFIILGVMCACYTLSSYSGLDKGIQWLSNINLALCLGLMGWVLFTGPTLFILNTIVVGLGDYIANFVTMSLRMNPFRETGEDWITSWTVFYWAWVIAWSPFVGTFVARISKGRTIREYVMGVLIVPPLLACGFIGVFGGAALHMELFGDAGGTLTGAVDENITSALFTFFDMMPFSMVLSVLAMCLIFVFLVTSADSASYIVAQMTDEGSLEPPLYKRLSWGLLISAICLTLIMAGGLKGLQTASLLAALPFLVILYFMVFVLAGELRHDRRRMLLDLYEKHHEMPVGADAFEARDILNDVWDEIDAEDADDEGGRAQERQPR